MKIKFKISVFVYFLTFYSFTNSEKLGQITRDYFGDVFSIKNCDPLTSFCDYNGRRAAQIPGGDCSCQCSRSHYVFREDLRTCIKDIEGKCFASICI